MRIEFLFVIVVLLLFIVFENISNIEKIDVHEHVKDMEQVERLLPIMDHFKISKMVLLSTPEITFGKDVNIFNGTDEHLKELVKIKEKYPDRFLIYHSPDPYDPDAVKKIESNIEKIDGLKFYNGVMPTILPRINHPNMYKLYEEAEKYNLPVVIHVESNEEQQFNDFTQVLEDFPDVTFVCPHLCAVDDNINLLSSMLDTYPNLQVDAGPWHRVNRWIVGNPEDFRSFFIKYQDRIMFATDMVLDESWKTGEIYDWIRCHENTLEKQSFYCYMKGNEAFSGLDLPRDVLAKIYQENPERFLG